MRQFVLEVEDEENEGVKRISETFDSKMVYRKQRPVKILNNPPKVRNVVTNLKKAAIIYIMKWIKFVHLVNIISWSIASKPLEISSDSNNQRLLLGDSAMIPVLLKPQGTISSAKQLRIDQKK